MCALSLVLEASIAISSSSEIEGKMFRFLLKPVIKGGRNVGDIPPLPALLHQMFILPV